METPRWRALRARISMAASGFFKVADDIEGQALWPAELKRSMIFCSFSGSKFS